MWLPPRLPGALALLAALLHGAPSEALSQRIPTAPLPSQAGAATRSLAIPGWGQRALGQRRAYAYAAAEALFWAVWVERRSKGSALRSDYRDLAWSAGRLAAGERHDTSWAYYEALSKWTRSGAFDRDPSTAGLQPEEDPTTFNGSIWALARGIHFRGGTPGPGDPAWEAALVWYGERAYREGFLWDWTGREGDLAEYRRLIHESDDRFRQATTALGAVLANHLLAGADAFLSARVPGTAALRLRPPAAGMRGPLWLTLAWGPSR